MRKDMTIAAVGDLAFMGGRADKPSTSVFEQIKHTWAKADIVVGNLEGPLLKNGTSVDGKCSLRGHPAWAEILKKSGFGVVSLANNHLMDYGAEGLFSTITALEKQGIHHVGAGKNIQDANAPLFLKINDRRIAVLARTTVEVSSPSYADNNTPGVALFNEDEALGAIRKCAQKVDLVVMLIHWGLEEYHYPSPQQRRLAEKMIQAGAKVIIGHHPHVLQGVEKINGGLVAYSLGNFFFDEFAWQANIKGKTRKFEFALTKQNRQGVILKITEEEKGLSFDAEFTRITESAEIVLDGELDRNKEFNRFCERLSHHLYDNFWKIYALRREWDLRISRGFAFKRVAKNLYKIRPRHFVELVEALKRSSKVAGGKSTNPYE
jgi:hypothetical protein